MDDHDAKEFDVSDEDEYLETDEDSTSEEDSSFKGKHIELEDYPLSRRTKRALMESGGAKVTKVRFQILKDVDCIQDWRALSIRAPHITKIMKGNKKVENRAKKLPQCGRVQFVALHQSQQPAKDHTFTSRESNNKGKIIAICRLKEISSKSASKLDPLNYDGANYSHFYEVRDVFPLKHPISARGYPSILWKVKSQHHKKLLSNSLFEHVGVKARFDS